MQRFSLTRTGTASNRTPRTINRSLVFNLIRTRQPISRADLARESGLQRSTISLIVEDLIRDGWVVEGAVGTLPRGRRPTFLELNSRRAIIALDIHPAQTTVAVTDLAGRIVTQQLVVVPEGATPALNAILGAIRKIRAAHAELTFDGIGICLPGRADLNQQKLIFAPNLRWPVLSLKSKMERATGLRVRMDNVANACALAEVWFGSTDGLHDVVVVAVSEGIGTGIFANGQLLRGENGMAGEFGHIQLVPDGPQCACGNHGCWETVASNRAALGYYSELAQPAAPPTFEALLKLAHAGDEAALAALGRMAEFLGRGIRMIAVALAPREIVVVGDITTVWYRVGASSTSRCAAMRSRVCRWCAQPMTARRLGCAARWRWCWARTSAPSAEPGGEREHGHRRTGREVSAAGPWRWLRRRRPSLRPIRRWLRAGARRSGGGPRCASV